MFRSQISNSDLLMAFQKGLRIRWTGTIIPGEQIPNPSLSGLRSVPPSTNIILLSVDWVLEKAIPGGASAVS